MTTALPVRPFASPVARIAVIAALEIEARTLEIPAGKPDIRIYVSGPGPARAGSVARDAIADGAGALLSWGVAGALSGDCDCGDVIVPARVLSASGGWDTDAHWRQRVRAVLDGRIEISESPLFTSGYLVAKPEAKRELAERSGASAVDMESAAVAEAAAEAALPCIVIRVIADGHADVLPEGIESLLTADGRTRLRGLWPLLLAPSRIPPLLVLARRSAAARRVLRELAVILTEQAN